MFPAAKSLEKGAASGAEKGRTPEIIMDETNSTQEGFGKFLLAVPWPWHLALAVAGYLILHALAVREIPMPVNSPDETALYAHRLLWKKAAAIFQYLLPGAFAVAAIFSLRQAGKRRPEDK